MTDKHKFDSKERVLDYFNKRTEETVIELEKEIGRNNPSKMTQALQPRIKESRDSLMRSIEQEAVRDKWKSEKLVYINLLVAHGANVAMLDFRNRIWPYDYMSFSRRVGELWESFCSLCFHKSARENLVLEIPPLFADIRSGLSNELFEYIKSLPLSTAQKKELCDYYKKVWLLVDAGEIKLELDMHVKINKERYNIDFKSGFGSNEKGNTNRLLVVASIYKNIIDPSYKNLILVRSQEEDGNHYLQTLKRSGLWEVLCGKKAYSKIYELTEIDLAKWIDDNIDWEKDLSAQTFQHLKKSDLLKYLKW